MIPGLDAMPAPADLRALARERQLARFGKLVDAALELDARPTARRWPAERHGSAASSDRGRAAEVMAQRTGDVLVLTVFTAPRTKKNHSASLYSKKSPAYRRFAAEVTAAVQAADVRHKLGLPLPVIAYNCAAVYYVDRYGKTADLAGLNQGLYDALQDAGVLSDDWWIRTANGTRIVLDDPTPRVELLLSPIEGAR